jgi:hypothetical protein
MIRIFNISIVVLFFSLLSCGLDNEIPTSQESTSNDLTLNEGNAWEVNGGISAGIKKMKTLIKTTDVETFNPSELSYKLHLEIRMMTSLCSTKGEAHNQLHNYIDPLKEQIQGLRIANEIAKAPLLLSIQTYLDNYNTYFK